MRGQSLVDRMRHVARLAACAVAFSTSVGAAPQHLSRGADRSAPLVEQVRQATRSFQGVRKAVAAGDEQFPSDDPDTFTVRVRLHVDRSIAFRPMVDSLEDETASLWRPYGVQIEWADGRDSEQQTQAFAVEVLLERSLLSAWPPVLGSAHVTLDTPLKPIRVSIDATEQALATRPLNASSARVVHDGELARALGRVLAHELGHVLLAAPNHTPTGLMRRSFAPNDLATPDRVLFHLTSNDVGRLRSRVRMLSAGMCEFQIQSSDC
jgi:hypothetical protein